MIKKSDQKGSVFIVVLAAFSTLLLGVAGTYWYMSKSRTTPPISKLSVPADSISTSSTSKWKIYTGSGISLKYPDSWVYENFTISGKSVQGVVQLKPQDFTSSIPFIPLFIFFWDNPKNLTVAEYDKELNKEAMAIYPLYDVSAQSVIVGGVNAYFTLRGDCSPFACYKYVVPFKERIWEISSQYATTDPSQYKDTVDQIISTIKFTY